MIAAVVAMAKNGVIGKQNELPWYLPADLKHFRDITKGRMVIMGRKTADSIIARLSRGLPDRENIVITRDSTYKAPGFVVVSTLEEALAHANNNAFIIGGQQIYTLAMPILDRLYITEIEATIDGDAYFPDFDRSQWREIEREPHPKDDKNQYDYTYVTLDRIK